MERFKDIDQHVRASDITEMFIHEQERSAENGRKYRRSDGYAKRGKSVAVMAADFHEAAAKYALDQIEKLNITHEETQESQKRELAIGIVALFENLLDEKGIEIPCNDQTEQRDRYDGDNSAKLYGMEYYNLLDAVEQLL